MGAQDIAEALEQLIFAQGPLNVADLGTQAAAATVPSPFTPPAAVANGAAAGASISKVTVSGNAAITLPTPFVGARFRLYVKQDATGSRVPTWVVPGGGSVKWSGGAHTLTTTASAQDRIDFESIDGVNYFAVLVLAFA